MYNVVLSFARLTLKSHTMIIRRLTYFVEPSEDAVENFHIISNMCNICMKISIQIQLIRDNQCIARVCYICKCATIQNFVFHLQSTCLDTIFPKRWLMDCIHIARKTFRDTQFCERCPAGEAHTYSIYNSLEMFRSCLM